MKRFRPNNNHDIILGEIYAYFNRFRPNTWMGLAYERICMAHIPQIKRALRIDGISTLNYSWRSKTAKPAVQIDLIIERADKIVNVCEVKYSQDEYELDKDEYEKINRRRNTFIKETGLRHASWLTMITTKGLAKGMYSGMIQSVVTLDDLFEWQIVDFVRKACIIVISHSPNHNRPTVVVVWSVPDALVPSLFLCTVENNQVAFIYGAD